MNIKLLIVFIQETITSLNVKTLILHDHPVFNLLFIIVFLDLYFFLLNVYKNPLYILGLE